MENMIRQLMLIGVLALIAICCPDRIKAQSIFGVGNASDDSNVVLVSGECNAEISVGVLYVGTLIDENGNSSFAMMQAGGNGTIRLLYYSGVFAPNPVTFLMGNFSSVDDGSLVEDIALVVLAEIKKVEVSDLDKDAKNRIIDLQDSPVRDIKDAGSNEWKKYENNSEPKLPDGGDYQEIYVADGDKDKRFVYNWKKGQEKLYYTDSHYKTWVEVNNPWKHGGPKFPPPKY